MPATLPAGGVADLAGAEVRPAGPATMTGSNAPDDAAWQFATAVYDRPGISAACLELQDQGGIDIVLMLVAGYAARCGVALDEASLDLLDDRIRAWRSEIVRPLRAVRRTLKQLDLPGVATQSLRRDVQSVEIAAERLELAALVQLLPQVAPGTAAVSTFVQLEVVLQRAGAGSPHLRSAIASIASAMEEVAV